MRAEWVIAAAAAAVTLGASAPVAAQSGPEARRERPGVPLTPRGVVVRPVAPARGVSPRVFVYRPHFFQRKYVVVNGVPCYGPSYIFGGGFAFGFGSGDFQFGFEQALPVYQNAPPEYYEPTGESYTADYGGVPAPPQKAPQSPPPARADVPDDSAYYLYQPVHVQAAPLTKDASLAAAIADIETAFRSADIGRLQAHVAAGDTLMLTSQGNSRTPLAASVYLDRTREAFKTMRTVAYHLDKVEPASNGAQMVYGSHTLVGSDGQDYTYNVAFVLKKRGDNWYITEVSADLAD